MPIGVTLGTLEIMVFLHSTRGDGGRHKVKYTHCCVQLPPLEFITYVTTHSHTYTHIYTNTHDLQVMSVVMDRGSL